MNNKQHLSNVVKKTSTTLPTYTPWLMAQRDSAALIKIARDPQLSETIRVTALEILGRRADGAMGGKLARLSKTDKNVRIKNAACRALHRSQYMRSKQGSHMIKVLENMI